MQKLSPKQFAHALHEATSGQSIIEATQTVKLFVSLLVKKRMMGKSDEVVEAYRKLELSSAGIIEAEVSSSQPLAKEAEEKIKKFVEKEFGQTSKTVIKTTGVQINHTIDEKLLGGIKVKVGDTILDGTLKGRLQEMKLALSK